MVQELEEKVLRIQLRDEKVEEREARHLSPVAEPEIFTMPGPHTPSIYCAHLVLNSRLFWMFSDIKA